MVKRKIIQLCSHEGTLYALTDQGHILQWIPQELLWFRDPDMELPGRLPKAKKEEV